MGNVWNRAGVAAVVGMACATNAWAQTGIDAQENVFGATNVNATTGHGRLTAGISKDGDLTVLSWPSPSYCDQLGYRSLNGIGARELPRFGAHESAGIVLGLRYERADATTGVTWLRDRKAWDIDQDYGPDSGPNPHTRFANATLGLTVEVVDAVSPDADALVRQVSVQREGGSDVEAAWLLTYANLSPVPPTSRVPELPIVDWLKDGENDFAAIWDAGADKVIHFHPEDERIFEEVLGLAGAPEADWGPIGAALTSPTIDAGELSTLVGQLDDYGAGVWMALGTVPPPDQHQVGFDETPFCAQLEQMLANLNALSETFENFQSPLDETLANALLCSKPPADIRAEEGWMYDAEDPWEDAQDGELSLSGVAAGEVAEALRTPLSFDGDGAATATVVLGVGATRADALAAADDDPGSVVDRAAAEVAAVMSELTVPSEPGTRVHEVARRSLLNLRVGTDAETGAVVASIARQPPYALDWPRDGAFFNVMLDASGQTSLVDQRIALYADWQRDEPVEPTPIIDPDPPTDPDTGEAIYPADAWEMNYFPDGMPGGLFRFEIDTTAFAVWTTVAHVGWVAEPKAYLSDNWELIRRGTELLARWRDDATGLHAPAQEDDAEAYTQTLHGAITVFGALDIAARAARLIDETALAEAWEARARELKQAIRDNFYDEAGGYYVMSESERLPIIASGLVPVGPTAWLVWPFPLHPEGDSQIAAQLVRDHDVIAPALSLEGKGGLYYMKNTISIAVAGQEPLGDVIPTLAPSLADQATRDTDHFGEVMVVVEEDGERRPSQRVSTPHLWEGTLFYLTALAAEDPEALTAYDRVLPPSRVFETERADDGCGCRLAGRPSESQATWLLVALSGCLLRRRRLRTGPPRDD